MHVGKLKMSTALLTVFAVSLSATLGLVVYGLRVLLFRWELPRGAPIYDAPMAPPPEPVGPIAPMYQAPPMTWTPPPAPAWHMPPLRPAGGVPVYRPAQPGTLASAQAPLPPLRIARGSIPPEFVFASLDGSDGARVASSPSAARPVPGSAGQSECIETTEVGPPPAHAVDDEIDVD